VRRRAGHASGDRQAGREEGGGVRTLWFKGISGFTLPLQASVPTGGVVR
jgi:hypothetical protein